MKKLYFSILPIIFLTGCSFATPPNDWQYKSVNAFDSYTKDFLSSRDEMAKNDLKRALSHAKSSADFTNLAHIYLGKCALNISVGIDDKCREYYEIKDIVNSDKLDAYYNFLNSNTTKDDLNKLPKIYQDFAWHLKNKDYKEANKDILDMDKATSQLLASSLIKDKIDKKTINKTIQTASFNGYKKVVIFWLKRLKNITTDKTEKDKIDKKISILTK